MRSSSAGDLDDFFAYQLTGDVRSSGTMRVVGRSGEFTYSGRDRLRKVGEFIDNGDGIARETMDW